MSKVVDFCKDKGLYWFQNEEGETTIQRAKYIEDGWFIISKKEEKEFNVFEIPLFGGKEELIDTFKTIEDAYRCAMELC